MSKILKVSIFLIFLLTQLSCNKEWLKPQPLSSLTPENVYVDKAGFESLLITMRKNLKNENTGNISYIVCEFAASDLGSPGTELDFRDVTPNTDQYYKFLALFNNAYSYIKDANVLITRIDDIKWNNENVRNAILSEAYWHRAYWYYRLVNSYGDVPWVGEEVKGAKLDFNTNTRQAILNKIQSDMEFAVQWLPLSVHPGEISKGAGNYLLAKIYLANLEFDKAISAATNVINGPYSLMKNRFGSWVKNPARNVIWDIHRPENMNAPANTETILAIVDRFEAPPNAKSVGLYTMRMYNCGYWDTRTLDRQGKSGTLASGPLYDTLGRGVGNVTLTPFYTYGLWTYGNDTWRKTSDLRRSDINWYDRDELLYTNPTSIDFGKPINPLYWANPADSFKLLYAMPYYITYAPEANPANTPLGGNGDWYIFRLAGMYLIRAEAYFWKGELGLAAADINKVRERAFALPISPGEVTLDLIFDERARELFAEEPRHSELVRASYILAKLNRDGYSLSNFSSKNYYYDRVMKNNVFYYRKVIWNGHTAFMASYNILWPVPANVILANTLGSINQNVGYDGADKNVPPINDPIP
jgi:hypothetical protein